jgi:hypothetical protein
VLKKSEEVGAHSDKTVDNPLSVAAMNCLMSMEVKLQTNLTEQNSKFIKVYQLYNKTCIALFYFTLSYQGILKCPKDRCI